MFYAFIIYVHNNVGKLVGYRVRFNQKCSLAIALASCINELESRLDDPIMGIAVDENVGEPNFVITQVVIRL